MGCVPDNLTGCKRKEGIIAAKADVFTWMEASAALAHDDAAGVDRLSAVDLDA